MKVLVTCPPMLGMIEALRDEFDEAGFDVHAPNVVQTLSEDELVELVPQFDGWIIGDDPATRRVFEAGQAGRLKAAVKWGIGVDNVDFEACEDLGIPISNTPMMFGREVADLAMSYVIALARETFPIHQAVKLGGWPKPRGISLAGRKMGLVGFGDIGRNVARRALASEMHVLAYDPHATSDASLKPVEFADWPASVEDCDFLVFTCALNDSTRHMLNGVVLNKCRDGVRVVNVARGPLIDESALCNAMQEGKVHSAALDVFEQEPLPSDSALRAHERTVFGSHNASNTEDAVIRASRQALKQLQSYFSDHT
jgi:D-3-phosphoglycerate dehydrogenase